MYDVPYFKAKNGKEVLEFIHHHPFITLAGVDANNSPVATHVPVLIEEREDKLFLLGHIMRQTDHHKAFIQNPNILAIFSGSHTYVSASWYKNPKQGSTWNYRSVHAKGTIRLLDEDNLLQILKRLTDHFENNPSSPSLVEHLPSEYLTRLMKAIVGFEIEVKDIDHVFKLSQNRDEESYANIIDKLSKGDLEAQKIATLMKKNSQL